MQNVSIGRLVAAISSQMSFSEIREQVCEAICAQDGSGGCCYIIDMFSDAVVYESCGSDNVEKCYRRSYSIIDEVVTLGDATEVERKIEYVPVQAACQIVAAVAGDTTGNKWEVRVCRFGTDNNSNYWDKDTLSAALDKFEGAKVFALSEAQHQAQAHPFGKSVRDLVGVLQAATVKADGIYATLILLPAAAWLRDNLVGCAEQGLAGVIGLSVDITGKMGKKNNQRSLVTIKSVTVDVVYDPAAGGEFLKMAAAVQAGQKKEPDMLFGQLLAALKKQRPDLHDTIVRAMAAGTMDEAQALERIAAATVTDAGGDANNATLVASIVSQLKSFAGEGTAEVKLLACGMTLDRELAASKLPEVAQENIRAAFEGKVFETATLQASIKSTKEMIDKLSASGLVTGSGDVRVTVDQSEKHATMLDDFFAGKVQSFKACYQDITGDMRVTGDLRDASRMSASLVTTGLTELLGDSIARRMVQEYNAANLSDWKKVVQSGPVFDFRTNRRVRVGGYGDLAAVAQAAAYAAVTSPTDEESTYAATKRGGTEDITLEAIRNDDVLGLRRVPQKLGRAAARTLYKFVFQTLIGANPNIYTTTALALAGQNNIGTTALAKATLLAGRLAMQKQAEMDSAEPLGIAPRFLLVPPDLESTAYELIATPNTGSFVPTAASAVNAQTWELIVVKTWTDANNWWLVADPADIPTIEIGFLDGKEEPELFVQDLPNVGSMFSNDKLTYKIRHIYGGAVLDYRGFYGAIVP